MPQMSSPWVPVEMVKDFIEHLLGPATLMLLPETVKVTIPKTS